MRIWERAVAGFPSFLDGERIRPSTLMLQPTELFREYGDKAFAAFGGPGDVCGVRVDRGISLEVSSGTKDFSPVMGWGQSATAYCHEHGDNGGECAI
jgi:hypothetical protein